MAMELASAWCTQFKQFCARLDASCAQLRRTMEEPPAFQRGENLPNFIDSLNEAVSSMSAQVESLEAMTISSTSLEQMFGHCMEVYKQNEGGISALEAQLQLYGYTPGKHKVSEGNSSILLRKALLDEVEASEQSTATPDPNRTVNTASAVKGPPSSARLSVSDGHSMGDFSDDDIFEESFSLRDLGLSSAALAAIADHETRAESRDMETIGIQDTEVEVTPRKESTRQATWKPTGGFGEQHGKGEVDTYAALAAEKAPRPGEEKHSTSGLLAVEHSGPAEEARGLAEVSEEEFKRAPAFLKNRIPLQDLNNTILELNTSLSAKKHAGCLDQADLDVLQLGLKTKEFLLLLVRLGRLSIERKGDSIAYRPVYDS